MQKDDDADDPYKPRQVQRAAVVGDAEEARELREWLSQTPKRERKTAKAPKSDYDDLEEQLERSKLAKSVLVKPARAYPSKRETRERWRAHQASLSAQVYFDRNVQNLLQQDIPVSPYSTDWRHVLSLLKLKTPTESDEWIEDGMKIELPAHKFEAIMANGGDEKIGAIRRRTGASIKVAKADNPTAPSTLLVSGTRAAINSAAAELRRIAGRITITRLWAKLGPDEARTESFSEDDFLVPPLTREEGGLWRRHKVNHNVYSTSWPLHMSARSFERYVAALTDSVIFPHINSPNYKPTKHAVLLDHERAVARRLRRAFTNDEVKPWISCSALKLALNFLCRGGDKYLPEARAIFDTMDQFGLRMDVDVFNIMLKGPSLTRNLRKFQQLVVQMTRKGFAPNLDTWILFLRMFESVEVKSYILQAMNSNNLLSIPEAIRRVAEEMAPFDTEHAIRKGKDLSTFLAEQDDRYGEDWLTRDAANRVLDVLCSHGRFQDAFELLDRMHAYVKSIPGGYEADRIPYKPDVISFNTIISHAKTHGKMPVAVNALRKMKTTAFASQPDRDTFGILFEIAWKSRLRSSVSVIWKYASFARLTTWRMRQRVAALLRGPEHPQHGNKRRETTHSISRSTYTELGGEDLARDLVGGDRALDRIRSLAEGRHPSELGVLAAKCWPEAFDNFGPRISLAHVLLQAVLRDLACLAARKKKKEIPAEAAKLNAMPLRKRTAKREFWLGDLAPLEEEGAEPIRAADKWVLDALLGPENRKLKALRFPPETEEQEEEDDDDDYDADNLDGLPDQEKRSTMPENSLTKPCGYQRKPVVILNPAVWADIWAGEEGKDEPREEVEGQVEAGKAPSSSSPSPSPRRRHDMQIRNENDILCALGRLEAEYFTSFRKTVYVGDEGGYRDIESGVDRPRDGLGVDSEAEGE
jgi:pentatricopeptide repeat protein